MLLGSLLLGCSVADVDFVTETPATGSRNQHMLLGCSGSSAADVDLVAEISAPGYVVFAAEASSSGPRNQRMLLGLLGCSVDEGAFVAQHSHRYAAKSTHDARLLGLLGCSVADVDCVTQTPTSGPRTQHMLFDFSGSSAARLLMRLLWLLGY
jgi:hypothetical protein